MKSQWYTKSVILVPSFQQLHISIASLPWWLLLWAINRRVKCAHPGNWLYVRPTHVPALLLV